jgi:hypothetical protein
MYNNFFTIVFTFSLCFSHSAFSVPHLTKDEIRVKTYAPFAGGINEFTIVEKNNKKGLFDKNGNVILPIEFDDLGWSKGMPEVMDNKVIGYREGNLWGLINLKNKKITLPVYSSLEPLAQEYIIASKRSMTTNGRLYGIVDTKGKEVMDFRYYSLQSNGEQLIASVLRNVAPVFGVINIEGVAIIGFNYENIHPLSHKVYAIKNESGKVAL